jgi:hypothetical protein
LDTFNHGIGYDNEQNNPALVNFNGWAVERIGGIRMEGTSILTNIDDLSFPNGINGTFMFDANHIGVKSINIVFGGNITGDLIIQSPHLLSISFPGLTSVVGTDIGISGIWLFGHWSDAGVNTTVSFPDLIYASEMSVYVRNHATHCSFPLP